MHLINFCVLNVTVCVRIYDQYYCLLIVSISTVITCTLQLSFVMLYTHKLGVTYYVTLIYIHKHHHE